MAEEEGRSYHNPVELEDVEPQKDVNIRVIGTVVTKDENSFVLDDSSAAKEVFADESVIENKIDEGSTVRVFGRVLPTPDDYEIEAEVVQNLSEVDVQKFKKIKKVVSNQE